MNTWRLDLEFACSRRHRPRLSHAVAHDKGMTSIVTMVSVLGDVVIYLCPQCRQQHAPGTFAHQGIQVELECILLRLF